MSLESAEQLRELRELIADLFSPADLKMLVTDHLGVPLAHLVSPGNHREQVFELVEACRQQGWLALERLVHGVAKERPQNPRIALLLEQMQRPTALSSSERGVGVVAVGSVRTVNAMGTGPPEVATHALSKRRDEELQALVKQLDDAYARKHDLGESGEPTAEIAREILGRRARCRGVLPGKRCGMAVVGTGPGR